MEITENQIRLFRQNGYLRIERAIAPDTVARLKSSVLREFAIETSLRPGSTTSKIYRFSDRSEPFRDVLSSRALTDPLAGLLGPNIVFVKNRHNHASINARGHGEPRFHRDILHWSRGLVTAILYLEDANVSNGCTYVIPGSHHLPFVGVTQIDPPGGGTWMDEHRVFAGLVEQALPVAVEAGGLLLFDGTLFHSVGDNDSDSSRISLTMGFRSADELDRQPDQTRQVLVAGELTYRGNDRA